MSNTQAEKLPGNTKTKVLLLCGMLAGPLFTISWFVQGLTRPHYNPMRHAISSLSVGESGWVQIVTFVVTGALILLFSVELWSVLRRPSGSLWGPLLVSLLGVGLIGAGVFVTDPLNGYPPGSPLIPVERTPQGILHDLFGIPFFLGLPIACFVFGRFFSRRGERNWMRFSQISGSGMFAVFFAARLGLRLLPIYPDLAANFGLFQRITVTIGLAWLTLLAVYMMQAPSKVAQIEW